MSAGASAVAGHTRASKGLIPWRRVRESHLTPVSALPDGVTRAWIGPHFWSNRLQDWRLRAGRIECLRGDAGYEIRTVSVLTRTIVAGRLPGHLRVTTGLAGEAERGGFCGFLVGVGGPDLDYRAAALAQHGSGEGGGFLCTFDRSGRLWFREHTSESEPLEFKALPARVRYPSGGPIRPAADDRLDLALDLLPQLDGRFEVRLTVRDEPTGELLGAAVRCDVPEAELTGGIALVSSPPPRKPGARWWFRDLRTGGEKVASFPDRTFGPIAGTLYTVDGNSLRLSAQLLPVDEGDVRILRLDYRPAGSTDRWRRGPTADLEPGYTALFTLDDWDSTRAWDYRVVYRSRTAGPVAYHGRVQRDPANEGEFTVGLFSCTAPTARGLEAGRFDLGTASHERLGRYTQENLYFPYPELVGNARRQRPDLLVFAGDQLYQNNPTRIEGRENPTLDYLYKWYLWVWAFRPLTRDTPTVVLVDDHDVYQQNLWGERGENAPRNVSRAGGYVGTAAFVNLVQRTQCAHDPAPYDPTPVERGIDVYYSSFRYGGVDFALLEDRKFKSSPRAGESARGEERDEERDALLGRRQKRFLHEWTNGLDDDAVPICLSQCLYACVETTADGSPATDRDSNGYPPAGRDDAIRRFRDAGALVLSGDRHLATLVRHRVDGHPAGVLEFSGPASASLYQRWFEPDGRGDDLGDADPVDFTDAFGNEVRVLAAANPKVALDAYRGRRAGSGRTIRDRRLKREGYGVVRVDHENRRCRLECWPWDEDPTESAARQFDGWPHEFSLGELGPAWE
ncbi:alkaline phosphatase D family protein [Halegenticoccus tardaugens]|uniref:alkaline phosphatase D family protein n=1 Tax=Halegenticoccus tardaugens TaxID=2071624 RepID=UPI0013E92223|nr:alkaline phosphatase D family protein [Halegenticoccus tardaugens]